MYDVRNKKFKIINDKKEFHPKIKKVSKADYEFLDIKLHKKDDNNYTDRNIYIESKEKNDKKKTNDINFIYDNKSENLNHVIETEYNEQLSPNRISSLKNIDLFSKDMKNILYKDITKQSLKNWNTNNDIFETSEVKENQYIKTNNQVDTQEINYVQLSTNNTKETENNNLNLKRIFLNKNIISIYSKSDRIVDYNIKKIMDIDNINNTVEYKNKKIIGENINFKNLEETNSYYDISNKNKDIISKKFEDGDNINLIHTISSLEDFKNINYTENPKILKKDQITETEKIYLNNNTLNKNFSINNANINLNFLPNILETNKKFFNTNLKMKSDNINLKTYLENKKDNISKNNSLNTKNMKDSYKELIFDNNNRISHITSKEIFPDRDSIESEMFKIKSLEFKNKKKFNNLNFHPLDSFQPIKGKQKDSSIDNRINYYFNYDENNSINSNSNHHDSRNQSSKKMNKNLQNTLLKIAQEQYLFTNSNEENIENKKEKIPIKNDNEFFYYMPFKKFSENCREEYKRKNKRRNSGKNLKIGKNNLYLEKMLFYLQNYDKTKSNPKFYDEFLLNNKNNFKGFNELEKKFLIPPKIADYNSNDLIDKNKYFKELKMNGQGEINLNEAFGNETLNDYTRDLLMFNDLDIKNKFYKNQNLDKFKKCDSKILNNEIFYKNQGKNIFL